MYDIRWILARDFFLFAANTDLKRLNRLGYLWYRGLLMLVPTSDPNLTVFLGSPWVTANE